MHAFAWHANVSPLCCPASALLLLLSTAAPPSHKLELAEAEAGGWRTPLFREGVGLHHITCPTMSEHASKGKGSVGKSASCFE